MGNRFGGIMEIEAENVLAILLVLVFMVILGAILVLTFSGGGAEISKNTTIVELFKFWS